VSPGMCGQSTLLAGWLGSSPGRLGWVATMLLLPYEKQQNYAEQDGSDYKRDVCRFDAVDFSIGCHPTNMRSMGVIFQPS
jgi:hypothetical protein